MRPTPSESTAGIARILRDTVLPHVGDSHASAQLQQVIAVLGQTNWNEAAFQVMRARDRAIDALAECASWCASDPLRVSHFTAVDVPQRVELSSFDEVVQQLLFARGALERFIAELASWRALHGTADSDDVLRVISAALAA